MSVPKQAIPRLSEIPSVLLVIFVSMFFFGSPSSAAILRVAEAASGAGNGTSWADAYPKLQDALTAAVAGDEIWVATGVYYPDERSGQPDGSSSSTFALKVSVPLYGGFEGTETLSTERDPAINPTVLSGDIGQDDLSTDGNHIAESSSQIVGTNASTVVQFITGTGTVRLDGFIVTAGYGSSTGGGLYVTRPGLTVANCRFIGNRATNGGAANVSQNSAVFTRCEFSGNSATYGGAAYLNGRGTLLSHCVFSGNNASQRGGAVYAGNQIFAVNCLFHSNTAVSVGGAWNNANSFGSPGAITQCTMVGNSAYSGGGAYYSESGQTALRNSIIWGNIATGTSVAVRASIYGSLPTVSHCDVAGSGGSGAWNSSAGSNLGGNLDANPHFLGISSPSDPTLAFLPTVGSPVINAGLASNLPADSTDLDGDGDLTETIPVDLAGGPRLVGAAPDMGVFETGSGPAVIASVPVLKILPNSGTHSPASDLSAIFDASAQSFALVTVAPLGIATIIVDPVTGVVSVTPLPDATGVVTFVVSVANASGGTTYLPIRLEVFPAAFFVKAGATGSASGLTWADAFPTLQDALVRGGSGYEIWVSQGAYFPDQGSGQTPGSAAAKFVVPAGITLRGGFDGTELNASAADPLAHPTILSGDVGRDDLNADGNQVAETTADRVGTNATGFLTFTGAPVNTGFDGFVITAAGSSGALKISGGSPFVRRCRFSGNSGKEGGAVIAENSATPEFTACSFSGNLASTSGGAVRATGGSLAFVDCSFTGNSANGTGGGGALQVTSSSMSLRHCVFSQNVCPSTFGNGGAVKSVSSTLLAVDCSFRGNEGYNGGALYLDGGVTASLTNCLVLENQARSDGGAVYVNLIDALFTGCGFAANRAASVGGALYHYDCSPIITLCTLTGNLGGAIYNRTWNTADPAAPVLRNCIIWGNQMGNSATASAASVEDVTAPHATTFSNCIIANSGGSATWNPELGINLGSNLDADPLFLIPPAPGVTSPQTIDLRLQAGSPAIDAGANAAVPADIADVDDDSNTTEILPIDASGKPRIAGVSVDIGAYEAEPGPVRIAIVPRLHYDTFSGIHYGAVNVSALFGASAVAYGIETQSSTQVISAQVGVTTGDLDITVLPEFFGTTLLVVRATDASGYSSYQTLTIDVYPPVVFVNAAATGSANGLRWQNAFPTLQAALQFPRIAGIPLEIWVAQGAYHPDEGPGQTAENAASTFRLPTNCRVYGGFAGNETQRTQYDPQNHPTILSGDLAQDDLNTDGNSIAESTDAILGTNASRIVTADACLPGDVIDGFTITAADGGASGGGLSCTGGTIKVSGCLFQGNRAIGGGGARFKDASATIANCRFIANRVDNHGLSYTSSGGGISFANSTATLTDSHFTANQAFNSDGTTGTGGAIGAYDGNLIKVANCDFEASRGGGTVRMENTTLSISDSRITGTLAGGGLICSGTSATIARCVISGNNDGGLNFGGNFPLTCTDTVISGNNKSGDGGGVAIWGHEPVRFTNCLIAGNSCWNSGGGIDSWASDAVFMNCTFAANRSNYEGGAVAQTTNSGTSLRFINCILWANQTAGSTTIISASFGDSPYSTPNVHFRNCIVANSGSSAAWNPLSGYDDGGNLDADPRFLVPLSPAAAPSSGGDFQIGYQSPALEAGDNALVSTTTDLIGAPRITNGIVDMGPYEGQNDQFDLDGDGMSDAFELAATVPPSRTALTPDGDEDGDGRSNLLEFALGSDPTVAEQIGNLQPLIIENAGNRFLSITYHRNHWATQFLDMEVERSLDAGREDPWSIGKTIVDSELSLGGDVDVITERSLSPVSAQTAEFLRLHVRKATP